MNHYYFIALILQLLITTDNVDVVDDVLEYICSLGDKSREMTVTQTQALSDSDKMILSTTVNDLLTLVATKTLPEVLAILYVVV